MRYLWSSIHSIRVNSSRDSWSLTCKVNGICTLCTSITFSDRSFGIHPSNCPPYWKFSQTKPSYTYMIPSNIDIVSETPLINKEENVIRSTIFQPSGKYITRNRSIFIKYKKQLHLILICKAYVDRKISIHYFPY